MARPSVEPPYGGPKAKPIIRRSLSRWQDAARRAASMQSIPESSTDLRRVLGRIPSLPNKIQPDAERIKGYSTWRNCDTSCCLGTKKERDQTIYLRKSHPTTCKLSSSQSFREWDGSPNNGIALLVAGWAYILSASLAERQGLPMEYCKPEPSDSSHPAGSIKPPGIRKSPRARMVEGRCRPGRRMDSRREPRRGLPVGPVNVRPRGRHRW